MILLLDNHDSFTWNLYQQIASLGAEVRVLRSDALPLEEVLAQPPAAVVIGPGPGRPAQAGISPRLFEHLPDRTPLLGVCLGHQGLVEHYGGVIEIDPIPVHGRVSRVHHDARGLFAGLPVPFEAGRYHSLRARRASLPSCLELCAWSDDGVVMGVRHRALPRFGVQFHPESVLTPEGGRLMENFLALCGRAPSAR